MIMEKNLLWGMNQFFFYLLHLILIYIYTVLQKLKSYSSSTNKLTFRSLEERFKFWTAFYLFIMLISVAYCTYLLLLSSLESM